MTADLSSLPQHVRDALNQCDEWMPHTVMIFWDRVRAELLRLSRDNEALRSKCNVLMSGSTRHLGRAERAEAELAQMKAERDAALASNRDCMDWFEQMRVDYYALRKRIAEAPIYEMPLRKPTNEAGWCGVIASAKALKEARGKRVALLTVTDEDKL